MSNEYINQDEVKTSIYMTYDYSKFNFLKENRKLNTKNYAKLLASMKEEQLIIPVLVNENYCIVDGQHRFTVSKELGLPVYYYMIEGYNISEVRRANMVSSNWTKNDFLNMHVQEGKEDYIELKKLSDDFKITINDLLRLFAAVQNKNQRITMKNFEKGTFTIDGKEIITNFLNDLQDFKFFKNYNSKPFVAAFSKLYFNDRYSHKRMLQRLQVRSMAVEKRVNTDDYLTMLTRDVYSFGAVKDPIYYDPLTKKFY